MTYLLNSMSRWPARAFCPCSKQCGESRCRACRRVGAPAPAWLVTAAYRSCQMAMCMAVTSCVNCPSGVRATCVTSRWPIFLSARHYFDAGENSLSFAGARRQATIPAIFRALNAVRDARTWTAASSVGWQLSIRCDVTRAFSASATEALKLRLDADAKGSRVAPEGIGAAGACGTGGAADAGDVVLVGHIAHERLNLPALVVIAEIEV